MVLRRVRARSARDQELLRWAAVLGERFDPRLVAVLGDLTEQATLEVAEALPGEAPKLLLEQVLEHALGAGDRVKSLTYSIQAANRSVDLGGYQEARAQYERALGLWRPTDGLDTRASLFLRLGYLTSIGGGLVACVIEPRSRQHFEEARKLYTEIGDATSAALATAGVIWSGQAFDVLDDLRQLGCLAEREFLVGHPRAALRTSAEGLALLEANAAGGDPSHIPRPGQLRRSFLLTSAIATWWLGDKATGQAAMLAVADEALGRNDHFGAVLAYQALSRVSLDWPSDALRYAERGIELASGDELATMAAWLAQGGPSGVFGSKDTAGRVRREGRPLGLASPGEGVKSLPSVDEQMERRGRDGTRPRRAT